MQGVYSETNIVNGKVYIGHSIDLDRRPKEHLRAFKKGNHGNPHLRDSVAKYGIGKFQFDILVCGPFDKEELVELEQFYMDKYKAEGKELYNALPANCSRAGIRDSEETRKKKSESLKGNKNNLGQKRTDETKLKQSLSNIGKVRTEEMNKKQSLLKLASGQLPPSRKSILHTLKTKQKMSENRLGKPHPNKGHPNPHKGQPLSEETKKKIAESSRKRAHIQAEFMKGNKYASKKLAQITASMFGG